MTPKQVLEDLNIRAKEFSALIELAMERYKDNQMEEIHSKIMSFRENYLQHWSQLENNEAEFALYLLDQFDLHFNLREI